jgi:intracellular sulfur oxidation DsrE/DsrF family protein
MRRLFMKAAVAGVLAMGLCASALAAGEVKVVYHLSEGLDQASRALANIRNHLQADPEAKIVVVTHGDGIKFLIDGAQDRNGAPYDAAVGALASRGVEFRVCNNTLVTRNIPANKVSMDAKIVPSGVAEVARLQAKEGYAYLHP